jgi:hypothetical protein
MKTRGRAPTTYDGNRRRRSKNRSTRGRRARARLDTPRAVITSPQHGFTSGASDDPWWAGLLRDIRCQHWTALNLAIEEGKPPAYEFDGRDLHVWGDQPRLGDRCQCGTWPW